MRQLLTQTPIPPEWQAWCDGTALPNPGRIGLGIVLAPAHGARVEHALTAGNGCNNEAELHALCATLELAAAAGARQLTVYSDSDFVVAHLNGRQQTRIERLQRLIGRAQGLIAGFDAVGLCWLPRHRNRDADRLARQALGLPEKPAAQPGRRQSRQRK